MWETLQKEKGIPEVTEVDTTGSSFHSWAPGKESAVIRQLEESTELEPSF